MLLKNQNTVLQTLMWNNFRFLTMKRNRGNYILYHPTTKVGLWIKTEYCLKCSGGAVLPDICCRSQNFFPQNKERSQFERGLQAGSNNAWERQKCWIRACRWEQISTFSSISEMPCCTSPGGWETGSCAKTITRWWKCSWWQLLSQASAEISAELRNTKALWRVEGMGSRWCASGCREGGGNRIISKLMFCVTLTARSQDKKEKEWASGHWKQHWRSQVTIFFVVVFLVRQPWLQFQPQVLTKQRSAEAERVPTLGSQWWQFYECLWHQWSWAWTQLYWQNQLPREKLAMLAKAQFCQQNHIYVRAFCQHSCAGCKSHVLTPLTFCWQKFCVRFASERKE